MVRFRDLDRLFGLEIFEVLALGVEDLNPAVLVVQVQNSTVLRYFEEVAILNYLGFLGAEKLKLIRYRVKLP